MIFPWPARQEREMAIAQARAEKERSQAAAADAALLGRDILRLAAENNWAARMARLRNGEGA